MTRPLAIDSLANHQRSSVKHEGSHLVDAKKLPDHLGNCLHHIEMLFFATPLKIEGKARAILPAW
ncbi:hypothetical protein QA634_09675 [Methylobacterium sp. CB376]|uniref:hypothetical protein n=1 Tax=unclassified Methylobacterium TaxID=2615210 RepID=UPI0012371B95|nr:MULTISPECIES: hypothetical protein [Methylobacterium]WFT82091.1 hypothetical protein QA634_09675 [Methylobacterium nodulans]